MLAGELPHRGCFMPPLPSDSFGPPRSWPQPVEKRNSKRVIGRAHYSVPYAARHGALWRFVERFCGGGLSFVSSGWASGETVFISVLRVAVSLRCWQGFDCSNDLAAWTKRAGFCGLVLESVAHHRSLRAFRSRHHVMGIRAGQSMEEWLDLNLGDVGGAGIGSWAEDASGLEHQTFEAPAASYDRVAQRLALTVTRAQYPPNLDDNGNEPTDLLQELNHGRHTYLSPSSSFAAPGPYFVLC